MARNANEQSLKQAIDSMLKNFKLDDKLRRIKLIDSWPEIMGPAVGNRTTEIKFHGNTLIVVLSSASLRQELFQEREKIKQMLNQTAGTDVIDEVIFQ